MYLVLVSIIRWSDVTNYKLTYYPPLKTLYPPLKNSKDLVSNREDSKIVYQTIITFSVTISISTTKQNRGTKKTSLHAIIIVDVVYY